MRKMIPAVLAFALALFCGFGCKAQEEIVPGPTPKQSSPNVIVNNQQLPQEHVIEVGGYGAVLASPDYATITIAVSGSAETAEAASTKCEENLSGVLAAATALDVPARSVKNVGTVTTAQQRADGAITGYLAADTVTIIMEDVKSANTVMSGIIDAAVCELNSMTYSLTDATAAYQRALEAAMADARQKAETVAAATGTTVGAVVGVVETPTDDTKLVGVDFETSDIKVPARVTVRYLIK